ncbi:MAG: cation-translocating P-type ATPase [Armatimonadota bacterium]
MAEFDTSDQNLCDLLDADAQRQQERDMPQEAWSRPVDEILDELDVDPDQGLSADEVRSRRRRYGPNCIRSAKSRTWWSILAEQFKNVLMAVLAVAAILAFYLGEPIEGFAITFVILLNGMLGFVMELRAIRSMEALERMGRVSSRVLREGSEHEVEAEALVPGDIVLLESGDIISADLRVVRVSKTQADESALTGESEPVTKSTEPVGEDAPLAERTSMLYKGTAITRGSAVGAVIATGMNSELGIVSELAESAEKMVTPLEEKINTLGTKLVIVTSAVVVMVVIAGLLREREPFEMIRTGIALAVATIPEGLPIVATIALARGMLRMARRNALINRLSAVETLGSTGIIATDKTGTITENRLTARELRLNETVVSVSGGPLTDEGEFEVDDEAVEIEQIPGLRAALEIGVLCNEASLREKADHEFEPRGEPLEVALLIAARKAGLDADSLVEQMPRVDEEPFDPERKMMATVHELDDRFRYAIKGAPEAVLDASTHERRGDEHEELTEERRGRWIEQNEAMARRGLRVIALAEKYADDPGEDVYKGLRILALMGTIDPARADAPAAIRECRDAGIRVVMVTGDQAMTAQAVAREVGLISDEDGGDEQTVLEGSILENPDELSEEDREAILRAPVFARVSPKQKLNLVQLYQREGDLVAMTGDGVNDAPALKTADIGVAMGQRGTQVAREASDMILQDDALSTIVVAVREGRIIFSNLRKFVTFLLSCNASEVVAIGIATLTALPLPLLPLQILLMNLVTDVLPALALGVGEGPRNVMDRKPRPADEPVLTTKHWRDIGMFGVFLGLVTLGAFLLALNWLELEKPAAVTVGFLTLATSQLFHVNNVRDRQSSIFINEITTNHWLWGALAVSVTLLVASVTVPSLKEVFGTFTPDGPMILLILGMSVIPMILGQLYLGLQNRVAERTDD